MKPRRVLILLIFAIAIVAVYLAMRRHLSLDALVAEEDRLRQLVVAFPVQSWLVGLAIYVAASLVPGTEGKALVFGWLFGFWPALVMVNLGLGVAAVISFLVIRYVFQSAAHRRLGKLIRHIDEALHREGPLYLVTLRLLHVPYTVTNYAAAATTVRTRTFWWTTHVGMLPGSVAFVLAGSQIPSLRQLIQEGIWSAIDFPLLAVLSLAALLPVYVRSAVRRWRRKRGRTSQRSTLSSARHANQQ